MKRRMAMLRKPLTRFSILATLTVTLLVTGTAAGQENVLYSFGLNQADGSTPVAGLIFGGTGKLFGTTPDGGAFGNCGGSISCGGTVFELTPITGGGWTETLLHSFDPNARDGFN